MKFNKSLIFASLFSITSLAQADVYFDTAEVIDSQPIYKTSYTTKKECHEEQVGYERVPTGRKVRQKDDGTGGAVIGGIVGGLLGNTVGKGNGKTAAVATGAVLGTIVGGNIDRNDGGNKHYRESYREIPRYENVCTVIKIPVEELDGYRVTYVYNGREFNEHMRYDPGHTLRVKISINPTIDY